MSHVVNNIGRSYQHGAKLGLIKKLIPNSASSQFNFFRLKSSSTENTDVTEIDNVVKDVPIRYRNRFNHERKRRPVTSEPQYKIVFKKKDEVQQVYPTLEERLLELDPKLYDPELYKQVNIGMTAYNPVNDYQEKKKRKTILSQIKRDKALNKLANDHKLEIDIAAVQQEWLQDAGPVHIRSLASHCGIFRDLFGPYAYFDALVPLRIEYDYSDEEVSPVFRGNIIKPAEARQVPSVSFPSSDDALWTLALTNPDGDLYKVNSECCHWLVTNIQGGDVSAGDELVPYLPPVPPRGLGYQRMVFVLYRQTQRIEHKHEVNDPFDLRYRSFSTEQFYRQHEAAITPVGLSWYNTDWDTSLSQYYHNTLGMKEPVFEYEFPGPYMKPEERFAGTRDFTLYIDRYRDPKETAEMLLLRRLKRINPFKKETSKLPFAGAQPIDPNLPSWARQKIKQERLGWGRYRELYRNEYYVDALHDDETLREAAEVEVDKGHSARMGEEWQKIHVGYKKTKVINAKNEAAETAERISRVTIAKLD